MEPGSLQQLRAMEIVAEHWILISALSLLLPSMKKHSVLIFKLLPERFRRERCSTKLVADRRFLLDL